MTLRVGLVGCGNIAGNHGAAYQSLAGVELVACCDRDTVRAERFATEHGIAHSVGTLDELWLHDLDAVSVCTPHPAHEEVVLAAAAHGVHVLCEKPIAVDVDAAARMVSACDSAGVAFGVLFQRRFWPAAQRIKRAIDEGTLGEPILGHASVLLRRDADYYTADPWRGRWDTDGGGVLMTQAVHNVDLLQWFMGDVVEVSAWHDTFRHSEVLEVEDTLVATLRFASGGLATLEASTALRPGLGTRVRVTGRSGATVSLAEYPEGTEARNDVWAVPGTESAGSPYGSGLVADVELPSINRALRPFHKLQIADFVEAVHSGRQPLVTGREATRALAVVTAIYASAQTGTSVPVPTLSPSPKFQGVS